MHMAISDNCMPVCAILTSASLNDCEVAIPLANKANQLVQNFYDLMDSAYDVAEVKEITQDLGYDIFSFTDFLFDKGEMTYDEFRKCGLYPFRALNFVAVPRSA